MTVFEEYKKQTEPEKYKKAENWGIAIGLQQVDGLTPSKYLIQVAKDNIEGKISIDEANKQVSGYYKQNPAKTIKETNEQEADEVSARITKLLSNHTFSFRPSELLSIHKALFTGILEKKYVGKFRKINIEKAEPILNGETVAYGNASSIKETLEYDFEQERNFNYVNLTKKKKIERLAKFTSGIWQIHPFAEGNTRTTAVFIIKYLYTLGFETNNDMFEAHAKYFRNALVRANYQNLEMNIPYTMEYLNNFFGNLLLGEHNALSNEIMQVKDNSKIEKGSQKSSQKSSQKILDLIKRNNAITTTEIAEILDISRRAVAKQISSLKDSDQLRRIGPDKGGHWEVVKK